MDFLSSWSCLLPLIFGLVWLLFLSKESVIILVIVFLACIPQILHITHVKDITVKSLAYNLYTPAEFFLLLVVFYKHIETKKNLLFLQATAVVYFIFSLFFIFYFGLSKQFIPEWAALNNLIYTSWILIIFFEQYRYINQKSLDFNSPFFWYITGLLFYAACSAMIFSMWNYMQDNNTSILKMFHEIFNINMYIFFTIGFLKEYKLNKLSTK